MSEIFNCNIFIIMIKKCLIKIDILIFFIYLLEQIIKKKKLQSFRLKEEIYNYQYIRYYILDIF